MQFRPLVAVAVAAVMMFAASSCGDKDDTNSGSRPSVDELRSYLDEESGGAAPDSFVDCVAEEVHGSDIPNGVLRAWVDGRDAEVREDNAESYENIQEDIAQKCISASLGDLDLGDIDLDDLEGFED